MVPLSPYLSVSAPLPMWTRSPASGGTRNMKAVRKARDDGWPNEHVHVEHTRPPHVDRVHDGWVLLRRHVVKHLQRMTYHIKRVKH